MEKNTSDSPNPLKLTFKLTLNQPIELVYDGLTSAEHLQHWYGPEHVEITSATSNPEVDGQYCIEMHQKDDPTIMRFLGKYLEINPPTMLSYTSAFSMGEQNSPTQKTKITITLQEKSDLTELNFEQTGFADKRSLEGARRSWPGIYDNFSSYLESL